VTTASTLLRRWRTFPAAIRWGAITAGFVAVLVVFLALFDWNLARGAIGRIASGRMDREVRIEGPLDLRLFSSAPSVEIRQLRIRNPDWFGPGTMATVERIRASIEIAPLFRGRLVFRTLEIEQPVVRLSRQAGGRANWWMHSSREETSHPTRLPIMRSLRLREATLRVDDAFRKLTFVGKVAADEQARSESAQPFRLRGQGMLNGEPFMLALTGNPLASIRIDQPYAFAATVNAGATRVRLRGAIERPFDFARFDAKLKASGRNLADLYYLTGVPFPLTAAYRLSARLLRSGSEIMASHIVGEVGDSDLRGTATLRTGGKRPFLSANLVSHSLRLRDLGVAFGAEPTGEGSDDGTEDARADAAADGLLPDREFPFDRLTQIDAKVDFRGDAVQTVRVPLESVMFNVRLTDGLLQFEPVVFTMPKGRLAGSVTVDTRAAVPETAIDMRLSGVRLEQFKRKDGAPVPISGMLAARAQLKGNGRSVHAVASSADGAMTAVIPRGQVREAIVELTGINVLRGLGLLLSQSEQTTDIRCGVAEFKVSDGRATAERIVLDTEHVLVVGDGHVNLDREALDLELTGKPKEPRLGRLRSPVTVGGTLSRPAFGIKAEKVAEQGGIAATLGALLGPIGAALAFVDPGLAKDADCGALLADASVRSGP
jgi:hypothetical protein